MECVMEIQIDKLLTDRECSGETQADRQTDRWCDRQTGCDGETDRTCDGETVRQINRGCDGEREERERKDVMSIGNKKNGK